MPRLLTFFFLLSSVLGLIACDGRRGGSTPPPTNTDSGTTTDSGVGVDSAIGVDGGTGVDSGPGTDSGTGTDSGGGVDTGPDPECTSPAMCGAGENCTGGSCVNDCAGGNPCGAGMVCAGLLCEPEPTGCPRSTITRRTRQCAAGTAACYDACTTQECADDCIAAGGTSCGDCTLFNAFWCFNSMGCQDEWNCVIACGTRAGCSTTDIACIAGACDPEATAYDACSAALPAGVCEDDALACFDA